jgi:hypothetical protein
MHIGCAELNAGGVKNPQKPKSLGIGAPIEMVRVSVNSEKRALVSDVHFQDAREAP